MLKYLETWLQEELKVVKSSNEIYEVKKAQGRIEVLEKVLGLEAELKEYDKKLRDGTLKPKPPLSLTQQLKGVK